MTLKRREQLAGDLMTAIALLPEDHFVTFRKEKSEEDEEDEKDNDNDEPAQWFLTACVFQEAPEDGWTSRGAYFRQPSNSPSHQDPCPSQWKQEPGVLFGVSADPGEPQVLERLLIAAIVDRWGTKR